MSNQPSDLEDNIPSELKGRYVDFKFVGHGGMGRIFSATDTALDKRVAIKVLPIMSSSDTAVVRFHQEAKTVSKLNHQHIVQVLDFGLGATGEPYLVMEYVNGQTLEALIEREERLPLRTAVNLAIQICSGLQQAHANKIIHRDLKPANIMLDENNVVRILDFGLAKIVDQENIDWRLTRPGQAIGSPLYMSPEQLRGEKVDERTDIYSLGLVIFKMITGTVPLEDENIMRILMGRLQDAPPVLPSNDEMPLLNEALGEIIEGALQPDRENRTSSMSDLRDALVEAESIVEVKQVPEEDPNWFKARILTKTNGIAVLAIASIVFIVGIPFVQTLRSYQVPFVHNLEHDAEGAIKKDRYGFILRDKEPKEMIPDIMTDGPLEAPAKDPERTWWICDTNLVNEDLKRLLGHRILMLSLATNKNFTVEGIKTITQLPLKHLSLRETHLGNEIIPYINEMHDLQYLELRETKVTDEGIKQLKPSTKLRYLSVSYLSGVTDASLPLIVQKFPRLKSLNLSSTSVTRNGLRLLKPLPLASLDVSALKLTDEDMDLIVMLHPASISVEENPITDKGLDKLKTLKNILKLNVEYCNKVSDKKLNEFKEKYPGIVLIRPLRQGADVHLSEMEREFTKEPEKFELEY